MTVRHMIYQNDPKSLQIDHSDKASHDSHMIQFTNLQGFQNMLGTAFL